MPTWLQQKAGAIIGGVGKAIDIAGKATGNRLPELKISENLERIGGMLNPRPVYAASLTPQQNYSYYNYPTSSPYTPTTATKTGGGGGIVASNPQPQGIDTSNIQQNVATGNEQIDRDYELFMSQLGGAESGLRSQAETSTAAIGTAYAPAKTALQEQEATKLQGLAGQTQLAQTQEKTALQQNRDLFRQIQQQNIAQLSGLGISSSSVAEALAENLGVETARRIASVSQSANDVYQNIAKEKTNIETYTKQKLADMEGTIASEKANIQTQLMSGLNQINSARATAAVDKANRRADLLQSAQNAIYQLQANAQNFAQSLQTWAAQNTSALNNASKTDYNSIFANAIQNLPGFSNQLAGYGLNADYTISPTGQITTKVSTKKQPTTYEEWLQQQAGP